MSIRTASSGIVVSIALVLAMPACSSDPDPAAEGSSAGAAGRGAGGRAASGGASGTPMVTGGISASLAGASAILAGAGESAQAGAVGASGGTSGVPAGGGGQQLAGSPGAGGATIPGAAGTASSTTPGAAGSVVSYGGAASGGAAAGGVPAAGAGVGGKAAGGAVVGGAGVAGRATSSVAGIAGRATGGAASGGAPLAGRAGSAGASVVAGANSGGSAGAAAAGSSSTAAGAAGADQGQPSCAGGLICQGESCCTTIEVPGGTFLRGRGTEACATGDSCQDGCPDAVRTGTSVGCGFENNEVPENTATVSSFKLDKYPVTVGRMKKFLAAYNAWRLAGNPTVYAGAAPAGQDTGYRTGWDQYLENSSAAFEAELNCGSNGTATITSGHDDYPINCVNWIEAFAFCIWDGGRLPTEAEWEYAAAGGSENRLYPWGSAEPDATRARFDSLDPRVSVGSYPAGKGRWEHRDMAGLVWEWVLDAYQNDYYGSASCVNCSKWTVGAGERVLRGGSYASNLASGNLRAARRFYNRADVVSTDTYGFRCAR